MSMIIFETISISYIVSKNIIFRVIIRMVSDICTVPLEIRIIMFDILCGYGSKLYGRWNDSSLDKSTNLNTLLSILYVLVSW